MLRDVSGGALLNRRRSCQALTDPWVVWTLGGDGGLGTVDSVHCTVDSRQCTVYSAQCTETMYSVQGTVKSLQCIVYSVQCIV